jgi:hypothetical protein
VFDENSNRVAGKIIGTDGSFEDKEGYGKSAVFDNDPLTYFEAPLPSGGWVGLDFEKEVRISRIAVLPVNDGNHSEENDYYELLYYDENRWVSLGRMDGDHSYCMTFDSVPQNALLLFRNHTRGKQERIFTYEDNRQVWW